MSAEPRPPKVSVMMITYNHERFIEQAIVSAATQQTTFDFEIVVGEDCSTDDTRKIVCQLAEKYPSVIRPILHESNVGAANNFSAVFHSCRGKYVAVLEGDDYWTDAGKLQKQVNILDADTSAVICHHNAIRVTPDSPRGIEAWSPGTKKERLQLIELLAQNELISCTTMFRNGIVKSLPDWFLRSPVSDWPLQLLLTQHGDALYLDEIMSVYRIHEGSWSAQSARVNREKIIEAIELFRPHLPDYCQRRIGQTLSDIRCDFIEELIKVGDVADARKYSEEHDCLSAFQRLKFFYEGLQLERDGKQMQALTRYGKAATTGISQTRIGLKDIGIATARTISPSFYHWLRNLAGNNA